MTKNQYDSMVYVCRRNLKYCEFCPCRNRHCYKYYLLDVVYDFPNRSYDYLNINERIAIQRKKILKI